MITQSPQDFSGALSYISVRGPSVHTDMAPTAEKYTHSGKSKKILYLGKEVFCAFLSNMLK